MKQEIIEFKQDVINRLSRVYYDELLYFSAYVPDALINFNDVLLLKKGQKYISHTNSAFQKSIAAMFLKLYKEKGEECGICKTDSGKGRGVYIKGTRRRIHFLGQEKFVNFPRVNWLNFKNTNDKSTDLYAVMIKKNEKGLRFINEANNIMLKKHISTKQFILIEDLILKDFGKKIWLEFNQVLGDIENKSKKYQWFGLVSYYNELTQTKFIESVRKTLENFDYNGLMNRLDNPISKQDMSIIKQVFITERKYNIMVSNKDFCSSFITSEWLYKNMNTENLLEKTYIVTGYIKSIEQLMSYLIKKSADASSQIGILKHDKIQNIDVQSDDFYKATLGNMLYYLKAYSNRRIYRSNISNNAIKKSIEIIRTWIKVERNGYFHKHNIQSLERVKEIREGTFLLYFLLIGSIKNNE